MNSDSRLESRLGQIWRKLIARLKDSDCLLEAMGSHGRCLRSGREESRKTNVAMVCGTGSRGDVGSAGVEWCWRRVF